MARTACILVSVCLAAALARAAPPPTRTSVENEQQYANRLIDMDDTAAAHVALAKWCAERGMARRAQVHWQEALVRDPDSAEARAALGFVKRGGEWVRAADVPPEAPKPKPEPSGPPPFEQRRAAAEEVREVARTLLLPTDPAKWSQGAVRILRLRDEAAAGPVAQILGVGGVEHRKLACQALAGIPGDEALSYLLGFLLADESKEVHDAALEALKDRADDRVIDQLIYALARGRPETMQRAAHALGALHVREAVPALIANLRIVEYRTVLERQIRYPPPIVGGIAFVAGVRPVVGSHVVAFDPIIGYITAGGIRIPEYEHPQEVLVPKTQRRLVDVPIVHDALREVTDQDFGFDLAAWRRWYNAIMRP